MHNCVQFKCLLFIYGHYCRLTMADSSGSSKTFKLVMFGATGPTGLLAVKRALELGHHVTAIVRSPEKLNNIK